MRQFVKIKLAGVSPETRTLYRMLREEYGMPPMEARMTIFGVCVAHDPGTLETRLEASTIEEPEPLELYYRASVDDDWERLYREGTEWA